MKIKTAAFFLSLCLGAGVAGAHKGSGLLESRDAEATKSARDLPPPVEMTAQQDHQRMMKLLGITSLRPGADPNNPNAPNAVNYDEAKANSFTTLPDPLVMKNGKKVTSAKSWLRRRTEIVE